MCWLKPVFFCFFFLTNSPSVTAERHQNKKVIRCQYQPQFVFNFFPCFFLNFTAVPRVFSDGLKSGRIQKHVLFFSLFSFLLFFVAQPQCGLCFFFLCFLSFFLLEHLTQNHCWSSGGAVRIPTQGLRTERDKGRVREEAFRAFPLQSMVPIQQDCCYLWVPN